MIEIILESRWPSKQKSIYELEKDSVPKFFREYKNFMLEQHTEWLSELIGLNILEEMHDFFDRMKYNTLDPKIFKSNFEFILM